MIIVVSLDGVGETLTPWSQAFINIFSANSYNQAGREKYTVVLFREEDLIFDQATGKKIPFPVPYNKHEEILLGIARHSPKAILIDFSFLDNREGDDVHSLINQLCEFKAMNIPIYLSSGLFTQEYLGLREEIFKASQNYHKTKGCFKIVPVNYAPEKNGFTHSFDLYQKSAPEINSSSIQAKQKIPSAPLQIYIDHFLSTNLLKKDVLAINPKFAETMDIVWGWNAPDSNKTDKICEAFKVSSSVLHLVKDGPLSFTRGCPYSNTISVHNILYETSDIKHQLINNRVVLYGGNFAGSDDYLRSPANGHIPGVYLLGMVLDNLIVYGTSYKKNNTHSISNFNSKPFVIDLFIIGVGVIFYMAKKQINRFAFIKASKISLFRKMLTVHYVNNQEKPKAEFEIHHLCWFLALLVLTFFAFFVSDLGPRNFIAFFFTVSIVSRIEQRFTEHFGNHNVLILKNIYCNSEEFNCFSSRNWTQFFITHPYSIIWILTGLIAYLTFCVENNCNLGWYLLTPIVIAIVMLIFLFLHDFLAWLYIQKSDKSSVSLNKTNQGD